MNPITRIKHWIYMSRRVGAFSLYRRRGMSDQEAMDWVNTLYPASEEQLRYEEEKTIVQQRKYEQRNRSGNR